MKKLLLTVSALAALTMLAPTSSFAQADLECIGLYFTDGTDADLLGDSCTTGAFLDHITAYIVFLNPSLDSSRGFECGISLSTPSKDTMFNTSITTSSYATANVTNVGVNDAVAGTYNWIVGFGDPVTITGSALTLATLDIFLLDNGQLNFNLRASVPSSDPLDLNPVVLKPDFSELVVGMHQAGDSPSLIINPAGSCDVILPSEDMSFGGVKSLFR